MRNYYNKKENNMRLVSLPHQQFQPSIIVVRYRNIGTEIFLGFFFISKFVRYK